MSSKWLLWVASLSNSWTALSSKSFSWLFFILSGLFFPRCPSFIYFLDIFYIYWFGPNYPQIIPLMFCWSLIWLVFELGKEGLGKRSYWFGFETWMLVVQLLFLKSSKLIVFGWLVVQVVSTDDLIDFRLLVLTIWFEFGVGIVFVLNCDEREAKRQSA